MANFVKSKVGISVGALAVISFFYVVDNGLHLDRRIKRWGTPLQWSDFEGVVRPFSMYAAEIESQLFVEYDSAKQREVVYAGQLNTGSWVRPLKLPDGALKHEQYHFHITELYARLANEHMEENPDHDLQTYVDYSARPNAKKMQYQYDLETDHSHKRDMQNYWEFKIDSMLGIHPSGRQSEYRITNGVVFFPVPPVYQDRMEGSVPLHVYQLSRYGMTLMFVVSHYDDLQNHLTVAKVLRESEFKVDVDTVMFRVKAFKVSSPTFGVLSVWTAKHTSRYGLVVSYPRGGRDSTGYMRIANSFFDSFRVTNE